MDMNSKKVKWDSDIAAICNLNFCQHCFERKKKNGKNEII